MNSKISYAIAAILGGVSFRAAGAEPATGETAGATAGREYLFEITVTAQTLQQLNISTLDDYIKYLPNVTAASNGPGQNEVFMRGLSAGSQASQGSGSAGGF